MISFQEKLTGRSVYGLYLPFQSTRVLVSICQPTHGRTELAVSKSLLIQLCIFEIATYTHLFLNRPVAFPRFISYNAALLSCFLLVLYHFS